MAEDLGDKTEDPTQRRIDEARERGQVARSADFSAAVLLSAAAALLYVLGPGMFGSVGSLMRTSLEPASLGVGITTDSILQSGRLATAVGLRLLTPVLLAMAAFAYLEQVLQVGWNVTFEPLTPKFDRLSPAKGLKNIFSRRSLVKGGVNLAKLALVGTVAALVVTSAMDRIVASPALTAVGAMMLASGLLTELALWILAALIAIGLIDRAYQVWQHTQDLRMSKQEVKDERKSSEGDPETRARRQRIAREIQRQRLRSAVPTADVVVTNPTHFAVAIKYDAEAMNAPTVVAKGADHMALQIRLIASGAGVSIVERPALARALYRAVDVGHEVPVEWYEAVAEVLAYVYRLDGRLAAEGGARGAADSELVGAAER